MGDLPGAVLFDCDGVLVDSETLVLPLLRDDLATYGLDLSLNEVTEIFVGGTIAGDADQARALGAALPEDWVARFYKKMFAVLAERVEPIPGAGPLVESLIAAGVRLAVASNGPMAKMEITLSRSRLWDRFAPHIYSAHDVARPKPAPDVYLHAAARLGVAPAECVVVEDSASGARAGRAAGMRVIGFARVGQQTELSPYCDAVVRDMGELAGVLGL
ncbi:HAD family phosphatase [Roseovarius faecimaris]|uniref:HAD family phosphatase n=1 Tax=Roseovarius faecimaris TaxID=2494550 RepID=A0A6I6IP40_9RHOB|nr:HAD family phosphatase [Roseovarius faecimaris]QGX96966.1 HAD family phosphatase [Roseovarius faecimaris]